MLNLLRFLSRHVFLIQFILLEIFCFYLISNNNNYQQASITGFTKGITGSIYNSYNDFTSYMALNEVNDQLAEENAKFRNKQKEAFTKVFGRHVLINDTTYNQKYVFISCKVVNKSTNKRNNFFTLDKGELHGIKIGMGVVTGDGILGIVKHTSDRFCSVMTILHKDMSISAKIKKNNYFGSVVWNGKSYMIGQLNDIPSHVELEKGDTIVTSGYSALFPENITIGVIDNFNPPEGKNFFDINIKFSTDYGNVAYAYVIKNLFKPERKELEALNQTNDQ